MMLTVEKRKVRRSGLASLGWHIGYGYVQRELSVTKEVWCLVEGGKVIAECRGKKQAQRLADIINSKREQN